MLPGEADAAVHPNAVPRSAEKRWCQRNAATAANSTSELDSPRASFKARAASHTAAARPVSAIISAHLCLIAWNSDRPAELFADLAVPAAPSPTARRQRLQRTSVVDISA